MEQNPLLLALGFGAGLMAGKSSDSNTTGDPEPASAAEASVQLQERLIDLDAKFALVEGDTPVTGDLAGWIAERLGVLEGDDPAALRAIIDGLNGTIGTMQETIDGLEADVAARDATIEARDLTISQLGTTQDATGVIVDRSAYWVGVANRGVLTHASGLPLISNAVTGGTAIRAAQINVTGSGFQQSLTRAMVPGVKSLQETAQAAVDYTLQQNRKLEIYNLLSNGSQPPLVDTFFTNQMTIPYAEQQHNCFLLYLPSVESIETMILNTTIGGVIWHAQVGTWESGEGGASSGLNLVKASATPEVVFVRRNLALVRLTPPVAPLRPVAYGLSLTAKYNVQVRISGVTQMRDILSLESDWARMRQATPWVPYVG